MVTLNTDIEDGMENGACDVLKYIHFDETGENIKALFMEFNSERIGSKAKRDYQHNLGDQIEPTSQKQRVKFH